MESTPLGSEEHDDDQDSSKSRKKDAKSFSSFLMEPKSQDKKPKVVHEGLLGIVNHDNEKTKDDTSENASDQTEQADESFELLTEEEKLAVEQQIVAERLHEAPESNDSVEVTEAIDEFHHKILDENKSSSTALQETLAIDSTAEVSHSDLQDAESIELEQDEKAQPQEFSDEPIVIERNSEASVADTVHANELDVNNPRESITHGTASQSNSGEQSQYYAAGNTVKTVEKPAKTRESRDKQIENIRTEIIAKERVIRQSVVEKQTINPYIQAAETAAVPAAEIHHNIITARPEKLPPKPAVEVAPTIPADAHIESMRRQDLLELAEKVHVEGTTLRRVFETHLISEKGLRRVLAEYLRGGDVIKALNMEMTEHQIDFERDPILRDMPQAASVATQPTLDELLQNANIPTNYEQVHRQATLQAQSEYHEQKARSTGKLKRTADAAMIGIILVLIALIVTIVIQRM